MHIWSELINFNATYMHYTCLCLPDSMKQLTFDLPTRDILQCPRTLSLSLIRIRHVGKSSQDTFRDFILQYNNTEVVSLSIHPPYFFLNRL